MSDTPRLTAAGTPYSPRAALSVLAVLAGMAVTVTYVETMVLPAFKQFVTFFGDAPATTVAWILSAYLLVGTVATPIFGKLGDKYGKKRMLLLVMGVYAVAVAIAGFTPDIGAALSVSRPNQIFLLIAVRALQGVGMAMFPLAFAMIPETFPAQRVGAAQGAVSAMFATGAAIGLALGGWVAQTFGWQFTYHTVIPVAILLVVLAVLLLNESPHRHPNPIDIPGITALGIALAMLLLGITEGTSWGWGKFNAVSFGGLPWGVPEFFLASLAAFVFFMLWEPRSPHPVVSFAALRERNILVSNVNGLLVGMTMFLTFVSMTLLAEYPFAPGFGLSEERFGLLAVWSAVGMLVFGPLLGYASSRVGPKPVMLLGFALSAAGAALLAEFHATVLELTLFPIPILVGAVGVMIAMTNVIVLTADRRELGIQTGVNQTFRNLGSAIGPVLATTVVASFVSSFGLYTNAGFRWLFVITAAVSIAGFLFALALRNFRFGADGKRTESGAPARVERRDEVAAGVSTRPSP
jgi:MFS family permease